MQMLWSKLILTVTLLSLVLAAGCSVDGVEKKMLKYMEEKYQDKFELQESCYGQIGSNYTMIYVKNSKWNHILVRTIEGLDQPCYQDNYQAYLRRDDIEQILKPIIYNIFGESKVFYQIPETVFPAELGVDTTAEEILQNTDCMNMVYIYLPSVADETVHKLEQFRVVLNDKKYCMAGILCCMEDQTSYELMNREVVGREQYLGYKIKREWYFRSRNQHGLGYLYVHELPKSKRGNEY